ncbi:MAG: hypothetical protein J3Q66DRAFT_337506 [Benniella sp.]|nr:MAG: hypothetical protein J3Q66DRAFT_337506 [Benniella sp.]
MSSDTKNKRSSDGTKEAPRVPWRRLGEIIRDIELEKETKVPAIDTEDLSELQSDLINMAAAKLNEHLEGTPGSLEEAKVALSATLDMALTDSRGYISSKDISGAMKAGPFFLSEWEGINLSSLAEDLKARGIDGLLETVAEMRAQFACPKNPVDPSSDMPQQWEGTLNVVEYLCRFIQKPPFDLSNPSKAQLISVWKKVFLEMAHKDIQELCDQELASSKRIMESLDATFGNFGTDGRIVDFQLLLDGLELSNFEFEVCGLSEQEYKRQYLKNIRFHRSIMEQHFRSKRIRTKLYFMSFQGWEGILSNLYTYEDIYASRKLRVIKFPTSVDELMAFLENNELNVVKTIMDCIHEVSVKLKEGGSSGRVRRRREV